MSRMTPLGIFALILASTSFATGAAQAGDGIEKDGGLSRSLQRDVAQLGLSASQVREIFGNLELPSSMLSTDCHSLVAVQLSDQCASNFGEEAKRNFAISLTLCSMSAALQPMPTECKPWCPESGPAQHREGSLAWWPKKDSVRPTAGHAQQKCLSALYRSSQDWTTYNGYLRDATQLCFALSGQREADIARAAYANATQEKINLLRHLQKNEAARAEREHDHHSNLTTLIEVMHRSSQASELVVQDFALQGGIQETQIRALAKAISELHVGREALWAEVQRDANDLLGDFTQKLHTDVQARQSRLLQELGSQLDELHLEHSAALSLNAVSLQETLTSTMSGFHRDLELASTLSSVHMQSLTESLLSMTNLVSVVSETMSGLHTTARLLDPLLASALSSAASLQTAHGDLRRDLHTALTDSRKLSTQLIDSQTLLNDTLASLSDWKTNLVRPSPRLFGSSLSLFSGPTLFSPKLGDVLAPHRTVSVLVSALLWAINFAAGFIYTVFCVIATLGGTTWAFLHTNLGRRFRSYCIHHADEETWGPIPLNNMETRHTAPFSVPHTPAPPAYRSPEVIPPRRTRTRDPGPYQAKREADVSEDTPSQTPLQLDNVLGLQLHPRPRFLVPSTEIVERVKATWRELGLGKVPIDRSRGVSAPPFLG